MAESHADRVDTAQQIVYAPRPRRNDVPMLLALRPRLVALVLLVPIIIVMLIVSAHWRATVNGHSVSLMLPLTATGSARHLRVPLEQGDLLDVTGQVLETGAGNPAIFWANGALVAPDYRLRRGDVVTVIAAGDRTEPVVQTARFITPMAMTPRGARPIPRLTNTGVGGLKYVRRGQISGKLHSIQMAALTPAYGSINVPGARRIALTFDDGPNPEYTPQILKILAQHNARATFFVVGTWAAKYPNLIRRTVAEGHEIGCHSWSHADFTRLSADEARQQLHRWEQVVNPLLPTRARQFRPPYGAVNASVRAMAAQMGYTIALWSSDTNDWRKPGADAIYNHAMAAARDGAVVLMHDGGGPRHQTVAAVRRLVPALQSRGYQLVTMSQLHSSADPWEGDFIVHTDSGQLLLKPADPHLSVSINGSLVEMPVRPVEIDGQLLLPARPTLELLGSSVRYDKPSGRLYIDAPVYSLQMDMNLQTLQVGSEQVWMAVPPVLYRGHSMVPVWLLRQYCGITATWDPTSHTLYLQSAHGSGASALNHLPLHAASAMRLPNTADTLPASVL
jgi:peptidoglycan/xylan/chitin deacetylase (PgdA/CDA1 family)